MLRQQGLNGFQLQQDFVLHDQVCEEIAYDCPAKLYLQLELQLGLQTFLTQRDEQSLLINRLHETRAQLIYDLKAGLQNLAS